MSKLDMIFKEINKKSGFDDVAVMGIDLAKQPPKFIKFPSPSVDWGTYGGFRQNYIHQFCGPEGGGKTTTALIAAGQYQRSKDAKDVVLVDTEHAYDAEYTKKLGVDISKLRVWQPVNSTAEEILDTCVDIISSGDCGLLIIDCIIEMESAADSKKDLDEAQKIGGNAALIGRFCHRATGYLRRCDCTVFLINQVRDSMSPYENYTMPGGRRLKHLSSCIYIMEKGGTLTDKYDKKGQSFETPTACTINMYIHKAKTFAPDRRKCSFTVNYHTGLDREYDIFEFACNKGFIDARGAWYFNTVQPDGRVWTTKFDKINGKSAMIQWLKDNPEDCDALFDLCYDSCVSEEYNNMYFSNLDE